MEPPRPPSDHDPVGHALADGHTALLHVDDEIAVDLRDHGHIAADDEAKTLQKTAGLVFSLDIVDRDHAAGGGKT